MENALELKNITKTFGPKVIANKDVSLSLKKGEILSLLGENGSGKTTLMNMISGIYQPDSGEILVNGNHAIIRNPHDAFSYGIGMIHQHFKLVDLFSATENIILGIQDHKKYSLKARKAEIEELADKYGFEIDLSKKIYQMSVSEKQTVEILKVLYRKADILILDEPTAVLTPQEISKLFTILKAMASDGKSIIIITHKLNEVMEISDRVSIMRKGEYIDTYITKESNESMLTEAMVGKKIDLSIERAITNFDKPLLEIRDLSVKKDDGSVAVENISFYIRGGEILGVCGISGCGQKELCECIAGLRSVSSGHIAHNGESILGMKPKAIIEHGISMSFIPEDRLGMGLAPSFSITDNMMIKNYHEGKGIFLDRKKAEETALKLIERLDIKTPSTNTPVRKLSGGNVQKVLVGREINANPNVIITAYPVRGLDIHSAYGIYDIINEQKKKGVGVLFVGEDLDVMLALCDKIMVLCHGQMMGVVKAQNTTKEKLGRMMVGALNLLEEQNERAWGKAKDSQLTEEEWKALDGEVE